ncbi:14103_t:CDS:2 [Entrophospora sp. SA101]|nr:14103_t:CDS:2 [Entrophospora sp. SA101]
MSPILLILIALLNDAATLVIAVDNAKISSNPDKWRLGQLITLSLVLGVLLTALSFAHFYIATHVFGIDKEDERLETIMYLHISSAPHFVIFSTRLSGYFWENLPSPTFFIAVMGTQVFAMFISIYGALTPAVGWGWGVAADIVLLAPGLSTIVDGIITSRAIFQRMRSYALYRITSTVHFLIFFFFITLIEDWEMSPILLILIALLNDAATLVIAVDNAKISSNPDKWRLGQLITLSLVLGVLLTALSFAHFYIATHVFGIDKEDERLETIMYLHISSAPHFVIFSTRLSGYFWENLPSPTFFIAVMGTQVFAMFISIYGALTPAVGWGWGVGIIGVSLIYFVFLDIVKVAIFKYWSFELTARLWPSKAHKTKLSGRKSDALYQARISKSVAKVRKVLLICKVLLAFEQAKKLSTKKAIAGPSTSS